MMPENPTDPPLVADAPALPPLDGRWWRTLSPTPVRVHSLKGTLRIRPGAVFNDALTEAVHIPGFVEAVDLAALARSHETEHIGIIRPGELGDVLVALAACRWLRRALPHLKTVALHCNAQFHPVLCCQNEVTIEERHVPTTKLEYLAVDFTMYFEQDHKPGGARIPRLDRVLRTFGFDPPYG